MRSVKLKEPLPRLYWTLANNIQAGYMFNWLTHSKTRLRILKMFFRDTEEPLYGLEIANSLKVSPGTTHRELNVMLKQGVLKKKKEGALVLYRLNTDHQYFTELKKSVSPQKKINRVIFVSDLHLSLETPEEIIEDFLLLLDYAEENASELVFVGDMIGMLRSCVFKTYLAHKPVFDRVNELAKHLKLTYLVGNHDCFASLLCEEDGSSLFGSQIVFASEYQNSRLGIYATHGQQYDDFSDMKKKPGMSDHSIGHELVKWIESLNRDGLSMHQNRLIELATYAEKALQFSDYVSSKKIDFSNKFQRIAKSLIQKEGHSYIVLGHTHRSMLKQFKHGVYINTGSWKSEKPRYFVEIDKDGGALVSVAELR